MNLVLFEPAEIDRPLPRSDRRARHVLEILRRQPGDTFDAGLIDGPHGKATVTAVDDHALYLAFAWGPPPPPPDPLILIVGLCRPQTARDILRDATTLGVGAIHFVRTEKSEASYAQSSLWSTGEWRRHLVTGAEQAFATRLPEVTCGRPLSEALAGLPPGTVGLTLDNYESPTPLRDHHGSREHLHVLALGAERGWSAAERDALRRHAFRFVHLGDRVLRTETAVVAALAILRSRLGLM